MITKKNNVILIIFAIILFILSSILPSYSSKDFMIYYQVEHNSYSNNIKLSSIVDYYITKDSIITIIKSTTDNYTFRTLIKEKDGNIYYYLIDDQNKSYSEISKDFLENRYSFNNNLLDEKDSNMTEELAKLYMEYIEELQKELNDKNFKEHFKNKKYHPYCSCGHCSTCIENCSICKNSAVRKYDKKMKELQEKYKDKYSNKDKDKYSDKDKDKPKESDKYSDKDKDKYSDKDKPKESDKYSDKDKDKYYDKEKVEYKVEDKVEDKVEAKKTADNKIIDKYKCEKYDFNYKGKKVAELYLTKYKNLVKPEYSDLYKDIMNSGIYDKLLEISECYELYYKSNFLNILKENIVIKSNFYKDDKLVYDGNLKDFKIVNRNPKLFEVPKDYMKIDYKDLYKK